MVLVAGTIAVVISAVVGVIGLWVDTDPHGVGPYQDEYQTSSLYFDTAARDVFHRRGSYARAKYRVRCYNTADRVFLERKLRRSAVLIKRRTASRADSLERLSSAAIDADWAGTDVEVPATAIIDGRTYRNVGVHFRGQSSFMMVPDTLRRSLNLSFDFVHAEQAVGGFRTLNLLNAASDPTFVRGVLYSEIARSYIPAPRINYVRVVINGQSWGIYLNAQQFNKDFLRDFYRTENGARWKVPGHPGGRGGLEFLGDETAAYKGIYEIKSKDDPKAWARLIRMFRVLNETPVERLEAELSPLFDIDGALKFLAVEMALIKSDGYWTRASDYNIYQAPGGKFHVIPHDMNEPLLGGGGPGRRMPRGSPPQGNSAAAPPDGRVGGPPDRPWPMPMGIPPGGKRAFGLGADGPDLNPLIGMNDASKPLRSKLLALPALRARYLGYVRDIAGRWLEPSKLRALAARYQALIAEDVAADTRKHYSTEAFRTGLDGPNGLMELVKARRDYLLKVTGPQAAAPARPDPTGRNRR